MNRATAALLLPLRFAHQMLASGLQTVGAILRTGLARGAAPPATFVRVRFAPMTPGGAALLGCLVSLTPGTTVIDLDVERREMVLHVLDATQLAHAVEVIHREFEPPLLAWFGREPRLDGSVQAR